MILIPTTLTALNLALGVTAIVCAINHAPAHASIAIFAAAIFDLLDGWAARALNAETRFGAIFDSVADYISFGVAPGTIALALTRQDTGLFMLIALALYLFTGALRLVRFTQERCEAPGKKTFFVGLPITVSACIAALLMLTRPSAGYLLPTAFSLLAFFMIAPILIPKLSLPHHK